MDRSNCILPADNRPISLFSQNYAENSQNCTENKASGRVALSPNRTQTAINQRVTPFVRRSPCMRPHVPAIQ